MTEHSEQAAPPRPGLRERNHARKLKAIKQAARELFATHGYQATPLREIARVADVGFGTVSAYAVDKAGLAAMLFVEDLESLPALFHGIPDSLPLGEQVLAAFGRIFRFWARNPDLSRAVLPQLETLRSNPFAGTILKRRAEVRRDLSERLTLAQRQGEVPAQIDTEQAAETIFALYIATIHEWLMTEAVGVEDGLQRLRYLMEIPLVAVCGSLDAARPARATSRRRPAKPR